jgi:hypothetical protein
LEVVIMSIAIGALLGILVGTAVALPMSLHMNRSAPPARPTALAWTAFVVGILAVLVLGSALFAPFALSGPIASAVNSAQISMVLAMAGVTMALWASIMRDRHWVTWTALAVAAVPALFWLLFALGHLFDPNA